jgi:class 3 adenylate cyclase
MRVNSNKPYDFADSRERIDEILNSSSEFEEVDTVPNSDSLSYTNGYYFKCYSIFIDIRDSSKLPNKYQRKTLAKIYRAYISEVVALFQSFENCKEINIVGDSVWAVFNAKIKNDVLQVFSAAYMANSIINTLNYKLCRKGIDPIKVGIGIDKGDALMVLAGFKGSGINDVIYMGGVVNNASKLCSRANKDSIKEIVISAQVYNDLSGFTGEHGTAYQSWFSSYLLGTFYYGSIIETHLRDWLTNEQKKNPCTR